MQLCPCTALEAHFRDTAYHQQGSEKEKEERERAECHSQKHNKCIETNRTYRIQMIIYMY
uniref:Uncharacterized protein n=1 Tax=Anopheles quadriannulatus TaxID=34691 RepID=A0A182XTK4_ANOQN